MSRRFAYTAFGIAAALAVAGPAESRGKIQPGVQQQLVEVRRRALEQRPVSPKSEPARAPEFGVLDPDIVNVHAYAFQANTSSDLIRDDGNGYRYFGAPGVPYMAAPVRFAPGTQIRSLSISYCAQAAGDITFGLFDNGVGGSGSGGGSLIAAATTISAGCGGLLTSLPPYLYGAATDHPLYLVVYFAGNTYDGTTKFNNISIGVSRVVSPAPATASFGDVPTSDPAFQYVEALVDSGITAGCGGGGNYCPDNFVTRRQMAVFLAKALGLHWAF